MKYPTTFATLTESEKDRHTKSLKELEIFFRDTFDLPIYLMYGTLLGAIREGDYIPHDTDIDLGYLSAYNNKNDVYKERQELKEKLLSYKFLMNIHTTGLKLKFNNSRFDVWTSWIDKDNKYSINPISDVGLKDILLPFKLINFRQEQLLVPNKSEELLDKLYKNWKIPLTNNYFKHNKRFIFPS